MSEVIEDQGTDVPEATDDDFESGFSGVTPTQEAAPEEAREPVEEAVVEAPPEPEAVSLTRAERDALLAKADKADIDRAFGKIGELNRTLQNIQAQTANGKPIELTQQDLDSITNRFGDYPDLAAAQIEVAKMLASKLTGSQGAPVNPQLIEQIVEQRTSVMREQIADEVAKKFEAKALSRQHKDWQQVVATPDFGQWLSSQPAEYAQRINNSWDADEIGEALTSFKAAQTKAKGAADARQRRIAAAVTPKGTGGHGVSSKTDDDEFMSGFQAG